jgi:hypothetical protein
MRRRRDSNMLASPKGWSHLPEEAADKRASEAREFGGGGIRTRVREYAVAELYMRSRS